MTTVEAGLRAAVSAVAGGVPATGELPLRWGPFFARLDGGADDGFTLALELIYEGYLVHYRTGRVAPDALTDRRAALLAGDVLYARGLHLIAARGDVVSVSLLARLMAACSYLRSLEAPFAADDALWAYTMAALTAARAGLPPAQAAAYFDALDEEFSRGAPVDVPVTAAVAAAALGLADPAPLEAEFASLLAGETPGVAAG